MVSVILSWNLSHRFPENLSWKLSHQVSGNFSLRFIIAHVSFSICPKVYHNTGFRYCSEKLVSAFDSQSALFLKNRKILLKIVLNLYLIERPFTLLQSRPRSGSCKSCLIRVNSVCIWKYDTSDPTLVTWQVITLFYVPTWKFKYKFIHCGWSLMIIFMMERDKIWLLKLIYSNTEAINFLYLCLI